MEVYADGVQIGVSPYTIFLSFSVKTADSQNTDTPVAVVRMSPEHAKVMAIILRKRLKDFEDGMKKAINLPAEVYASLGLSEREDW